MSEKENMISSLRDVFNRWKNLLKNMREDEIIAPKLHGNWSIKDTIAHLYFWQRLSVARMTAATNNTEPDVSWFPIPFSIQSEGDTDTINPLVYEQYRDRAWADVYADWHDQFEHFIALGESFSEDILLDKEKYVWLEGYCLGDVLKGSYIHHLEDHLEPLLEWLKEQS